MQITAKVNFGEDLGQNMGTVFEARDSNGQGLCCMKTGGAVLPSVSCDLCFFGYRIGLGFGQRPHPVEHGTAHPCFGLLVG